MKGIFINSLGSLVYKKLLLSVSGGASTSASMLLEGKPGLKIRLRIALSRPDISPVSWILSELAILEAETKVGCRYSEQNDFDKITFIVY